MVSPRNEECLVPLHALSSGNGVFDGNSEGMADVEVACDVGRREADGEFFGVSSFVVGVEEFTE